MSTRHSCQPRERSTICSAAVFALGLTACGSTVPARTFEVDCSVTDDYELLSVQAMEGGVLTWYSYGDATPGSVTLAETADLLEPRCGSNQALRLTSRGHTDWGSGFGEYQTPAAAVDATGYDGVSFWARTTGYGTSSGFSMTLNDKNTHPLGMVCIEPLAADVVGGAYTYNEAGMIVPVGGELPSPTDCGNVFVRVMSATQQWQFYTLPFESFRQEAQPNRIPTGFDRSGLYQFGVTVPKDSNIELWIDDLGIYKRLDPSAPAAIP